jgi:hypothetical protein
VYTGLMLMLQIEELKVSFSIYMIKVKVKGRRSILKNFDEHWTDLRIFEY